MDKPTKAALYIRVSTHYQIDKDSLPFQRKELINYAKYALNISDYEIFEDAGYSGKDTDRPAYQEMMNRIKAGEFSHMLVWKIDRISRNLLDFTGMYERLKDYKVTFVSKNEQFDTSSAMGEAMLKIILIFAELERKLTAERVMSIMISRAEKGLWNGAQVPLGYDFDEELMLPVINEEEAERVRILFDKYEELRSTTKVHIYMNQNDLLSKRGYKWTRKTVADSLQNPLYVGTYRYNYRENHGRGKVKPENEWVIVENFVQPIINKEQFERVSDILKSNTCNRGNTRTKHTHIFGQLIWCDKCKKRFAATIDRARADGYRPSMYRCYNYIGSNACKGGISEVALGSFMMKYIINLINAYDCIKKKGNKASEKDIEKILLSGDEFKNIIGLYPEDLKSTYDILLFNSGNVIFEETEDDTKKSCTNNNELNKLKLEKDKYERALERLEDLYLFSDEGMSQKAFVVRKKDLEKKIKDVNKSIKEISVENTKSLKGYDIDFISKATKYMLANNFLNNKKLNYNEMIKVSDKKIVKSVVNSIIKKIIVNDDKIILSIEFINGMKHNFIYE